MTQPKPDTPFVDRRTVVWRDCDPAQIVYTPRFLDFVAEAIEGWFRHVFGVDWYGFRNLHNVGVPAVHTSLDFTAPVHSGDELSLVVLVDEVGRSSLPFRVIGQLGDREAFRAAWTISIIDPAAGNRPISIPDDVRDVIRRYQKACNDAGLAD